MAWRSMLKFKQGLYAYKSPWRGALPWLRERLDEAPSEKVRLAIEEMVSPDSLRGLWRSSIAR